MRVEELDHLLEAAMQHVDEAILITTKELDPPGPEIIYANEGFCRMTGYAPKEVIGKTPRILQGPKTARAELDRVRRCLSRGETFDGREIINYRKDGSEFVLEWHIVPLRDDTGQLKYWMASQRDVTERKALEEQLKHQAFHDSLTGLPNRALFMDRLEHTLARAKRREDSFAVLFLDLDRFKSINDSLGHEVGDELLVAVAERLQACLRPGDTAARLGGDEFLVLLEDIANASDATQIADRIAWELQVPFAVGGREVFITPSIGIALSTSGQSRPEELLRDADAAMYRAKKKGYGRYRVFDPSMDTHAFARLELENDLRRALECEEFAIHYQPQVLLETERIFGVEALVSWEHPERGLVPPEEFVPLAEETGLINQIGMWVLERSCHQIKKWQERYPTMHGSALLGVGVNLSAKQIRQSDLAEKVAQVLRETELDPCCLTLEISERTAMEDAEYTIGKLRELKELGVKLALDDFGTGYCSLVYFEHSLLDVLKIDRLFIHREREDPEECAEVISAMLDMTYSLGLAAIVEGVETAKQAARVQEMGGKMAQGFYFARPLPSKAAGALLAS